MVLRELLVLSVVMLRMTISGTEIMQDDACSETTRPHVSRCDQYFRCTVLSKDAHVWVVTQCQKGLVYMHKLGACVVPDSEWECNGSAEDEKSHSEENVYGIDNLRVPSHSTFSDWDSDERSKESLLSDSGESKPPSLSPSELNDIESSGDGNADQMSDEVTTALPAHRTATIDTKSPSEKPLTTMSTSQLESFLAYYDTRNGQQPKAKQPVRLDENKYLEHLKQIVNQQKQLNHLADTAINKNLFSYKTPAPMEAIKSNVQQTTASPVTTEATPSSLLNLSPGMQDIIKSILDISRQAIANQQTNSAPPAPAKDPIVKPIFIPISLNPTPSLNASPTPTSTEQQPQAASQVPVDSKPTQLSGPIMSASSSGIPDGLRNSPPNNTMYPQVLYDAYGNMFYPSRPYQMMPPPGYQNAAYANPYASSNLHQSMMNVPPFPLPMQMPNLGLEPSSSYYPTMGPLPARGGGFPTYSDHAYDHMKLQDSIESFDGDADDESSEKDLPLPLLRTAATHTTNDDESSDDGSENLAGLPANTDTHFKRKLFTLGDATFDYEQYKDSMQPLVDANPNDARISVVVCMVGSRQPNNTDCFRYYICNPHNGVFQAYTCPAMTAFNKESRMCDMSSYKRCKAQMSSPVVSRPLLRTNKEPAAIGQIRNELRKAQKYVELIRLEANRLRFQNGAGSSTEQKVIFLPSMAANPGSQTRKTPTTRKKPTTKPKTKTKKRPVQVKKVPRCRLEGRMPDPMDQNNYYVCHQKGPNKFIKLKMACPGDLLYCADTQYCTLRTNC